MRSWPRTERRERVARPRAQRRHERPTHMHISTQLSTDVRAKYRYKIGGAGGALALRRGRSRLTYTVLLHTVKHTERYDTACRLRIAPQESVCAHTRKEGAPNPGPWGGAGALSSFIHLSDRYVCAALIPQTWVLGRSIRIPLRVCPRLDFFTRNL